MMLKLLKEHSDVFIHGYFEPEDEDNEETFVYTKSGPEGSGKAIVCLNFTAEEQDIKMPSGIKGQLDCIVGNYNDKPEISRPLRAYESRVYMVKM